MGERWGLGKTVSSEEKKVMNMSLHLVHLRIFEEQDYAAYRPDSYNSVVYAKPMTRIFTSTVVM